MSTACPDGHGLFATADAQRGTTLAMLHELPASRIGIGETREPLGGFESRKARRLPGLDAPKECGKGQIQLTQRLLQGVAAERDELRPRGLDVGQRVLLIKVADRLARLAPGIDPLFQRRVGQLAVQPHPRLEPRSLRGIRVQLECGFAALHTGILTSPMRNDKRKPPA